MDNWNGYYHSMLINEYGESDVYAQLKLCPWNILISEKKKLKPFCSILNIYKKKNTGIM